MNSNRKPFNPPQPHRGATNSGSGSTPASGSSSVNRTSNDRATVDTLRDKISSLVDKNPRKAALLVQDWMNRPARKRAG